MRLTKRTPQLEALDSRQLPSSVLPIPQQAVNALVPVIQSNPQVPLGWAPGVGIVNPHANIPGQDAGQD